MNMTKDCITTSLLLVKIDVMMYVVKIDGPSGRI